VHRKEQASLQQVIRDLDDARLYRLACDDNGPIPPKLQFPHVPAGRDLELVGKGKERDTETCLRGEVLRR